MKKNVWIAGMTAILSAGLVWLAPVFTLAEDLGYLPRVAFNLDRLFQTAHAHGKQSLTLAMGYGCNAAGVVGWWVNPQAPGIDACGQAVKLMELTLATNS